MALFISDETCDQGIEMGARKVPGIQLIRKFCLTIRPVYQALLSNSCKTRRNTAKEEQKYQPIFLLVFLGSRVRKSQVYQYTKIEL